MNRAKELHGNKIAKEYYQLARDQIVHEDNLINNRTNWFLAVQGLLFTAFGVVVDIIKDGKPVPPEVKFLMKIFPPVGILLAVCTILSVLGAVISMSYIRTDWETRFKEMSAQDTKITLPPLQCEKCPRVLGLVSSFLIPVIFTIAWLAIWIKVV